MMGNWGQFDFSEFVQFRDNLQAMERAIPFFMTNCAKELANHLVAKLKLNTPVDTGLLRNSWMISSIVRNGNTYEIEVYSDIEYAAHVEYGHRQEVGRFVPALGKKLKQGFVEGKFMMRISLQELERELTVIMERKMQHFIERFL